MPLKFFKKAEKNKPNEKNITILNDINEKITKLFTYNSTLNILWNADLNFSEGRKLCKEILELYESIDNDFKKYPKLKEKAIIPKWTNIKDIKENVTTKEGSKPRNLEKCIEKYEKAQKEEYLMNTGNARKLYSNAYQLLYQFVCESAKEKEIDTNHSNLKENPYNPGFLNKQGRKETFNSIVFKIHNSPGAQKRLREIFNDLLEKTSLSPKNPTIDEKIETLKKSHELAISAWGKSNYSDTNRLYQETNTILSKILENAIHKDEKLKSIIDLLISDEDGRSLITDHQEQKDIAFEKIIQYFISDLKIHQKTIESMEKIYNDIKSKLFSLSQIQKKQENGTESKQNQNENGKESKQEKDEDDGLTI